jgi:hypothetical protein
MDIKEQILLDFENFGLSAIFNHEQAEIALDMANEDPNLSIERSLTGLADWVIVNRFKKKRVEAILFRSEFGLYGHP